MTRAAIFSSLLSATFVAASGNILITTSSNPSEVIPSECLRSYGAYTPVISVFAVSDDCKSFTSKIVGGDAFTIVSAPPPDMRLVFIQPSGVDDTLLHSDPESLNFMQSMRQLSAKAFNSREALLSQESSVSFATSHAQQPILNGLSHQRGLEVLFSNDDSALIAVDELHLAHLDKLLPRFVSPIALPAEPMPFADLVPVPPLAIKRVKHIINNLKFNPDIASIVSSLNINDMKKDIRHLSGEDDEGILSRHSFSQGARAASDWIKAQIEETGASCRQEPFLPGYAPNVICRYPTTVNTTALVLLSAHYDSRGSFGSTRAPGANDDGSGSIHLLAIAKAIKANKIAFKSNVELVAFAGEEQGLLGSRAYAKILSVQGADITLMIQADMLAYHSPKEPPQLGLPDKIGLPEAAYLVANVSKIYSPELTVGTTPACCSDHQSFNAYGFPATQVYERAGPIIDPMYHNSGDLSDREGYDLKQVKSIAKVTFATLLEAAGFEVGK